MKIIIKTVFMAATTGLTILVLAFSAMAQSDRSTAALEHAMNAAAEVQKGKGSLSAARTPGVLTVAGNSYWYRYQIGPEEVPQLSAYDADGNQLPDGDYRFSYRHLDDIAVEEAKPSELVVKRGIDSRADVVTGYFKVRDGILSVNN